MMATARMTRMLWIGQEPGIGQYGRLYGTLDVDCYCTAEGLFRALAARLPDDAVWIVTPLRRTRATAAAIARHHPAAPQDFHVEARLAEQNFGRWQGRSYEALAAEDSEAWRHFWLAPAAEVTPGGERFRSEEPTTELQSLRRTTAAGF